MGSNPAAPTIFRRFACGEHIDPVNRSEAENTRSVSEGSPSLTQSILRQVHVFNLPDSGEGKGVFRGDFLQALKAP